MRSFALINSKGQRYDLNEMDFFLYDPTSLGFSRSTDYQQIGTVWKMYSDSFSQDSRSGTIRFKEPHSYQKYFDFMVFAQQIPLTLEYTPETKSYYMDCVIGMMEKTEIQGEGLRCGIQLTPLSLFYQSYSVESDDGDATAGKQYSYSYPYRYTNSAQGTVSIDSDSPEESPCKITIYGPALNPMWYHYVNNVQVESGRMTGEVVNGHKLVIDTTVMPYSITEQDMLGNVIYNRYENCDFSTERFVMLKFGHNRISVGHSGVVIPHLSVEGRLCYASV